MAILIAEEQLFPLSELPDHLPKKRGRKQHISTGFRWPKLGLETIRIGGTLFTSVEALQRFAESRTARGDATNAPALCTPAARRRAVEKADRELTALGV